MIVRNFLTCKECQRSDDTVVEVVEDKAGACGSESMTIAPNIIFLCPACIAKNE